MRRVARFVCVPGHGIVGFHRKTSEFPLGVMRGKCVRPVNRIFNAGQRLVNMGPVPDLPEGPAWVTAPAWRKMGSGQPCVAWPGDTSKKSSAIEDASTTGDA